MPIQTYRDPKTGRIVTASGEHIASLEDYQARVHAGQLSGEPLDISQMPSVTRTEDGGIATKTTLAEKLSNVDQFKSNAAFLGTVQDIIKRKQDIQQPLTEEKAYWRTLQRDTSPFGGMRDPALSMPGVFSDERMREMSPSDQASIRASRDAAASAHLQGIREEEIYRGTREEDLINSITAMLAEKDRIAEREESSALRALELIEAKNAAGISLTDEDYEKVGVTAIRGKMGGSLTWRNNNPGAIKWDYENGNRSGLSKDLEAMGMDVRKGSPMLDGGHAISFATEEDGWKAAEMLLFSGKYGYGDLTLEQAMRRWSNNGYGADGFGIGGNTKISSIAQHPELVEQVLNNMRQRESWQEGTILNDPIEEKNLVQTNEVKPGSANFLKLEREGLLGATRQEQIEFLYPSEKKYFMENEDGEEKEVSVFEFSKGVINELLREGRSKDDIYFFLKENTEGLSQTEINRLIDAAIDEMPRRGSDPATLKEEIIEHFSGGKDVFSKDEAERYLKANTLKWIENRLGVKYKEDEIPKVYMDVIQEILNELYPKKTFRERWIDPIPRIPFVK
jgi:hypothetical protein